MEGDVIAIFIYLFFFIITSWIMEKLFLKPYVIKKTILMWEEVFTYIQNLGPIRASPLNQVCPVFEIFPYQYSHSELFYVNIVGNALVRFANIWF